MNYSVERGGGNLFTKTAKQQKRVLVQELFDIGGSTTGGACFRTNVSPYRAGNRAEAASCTPPAGPLTNGVLCVHSTSTVFPAFYISSQQYLCHIGAKLLLAGSGLVALLATAL